LQPRIVDFLGRDGSLMNRDGAENAHCSPFSAISLAFPPSSLKIIRGLSPAYA
jgi:hypothetical protein